MSNSRMACFTPLSDATLPVHPYEEHRTTELRTAHRKAERLFREIEERGLIRSRMSECRLNEDIYGLAKEMYGITTYWHKRIVRAGRNTLAPYAEIPSDLMIGEDEAAALGVNVGRLKWIVLTINVLMVAVATAFTGVISFVGLIVPHILRMLRGPDNRFLIPGSALLGGTLLTLADLIARMALRPAELPIGIVTAVVGVPVFLSLLRSREYLS